MCHLRHKWCTNTLPFDVAARLYEQMCSPKDQVNPLMEVCRDVWAFQSCSVLLEEVCWALGPPWQLHIPYRSSVLACPQWQAIQILQESTCASQAVSWLQKGRPE